MTPEQRKQAFVAAVTRATQARLEDRARRHASCVAPGLGPPTLARRLRADRLPEGPELDAFADRLVDWALGLVPAAERPFVDDDLEAPR